LRASSARAAPALQRIFYALQGDQGVDAADRAQADRRARGLSSVRLGQREAAGRTRPPRCRGRRCGRRAVGTIDAHDLSVAAYS
jgi:hypothetical protein